MSSDVFAIMLHMSSTFYLYIIGEGIRLLVFGSLHFNVVSDLYKL